MYKRTNSDEFEPSQFKKRHSDSSIRSLSDRSLKSGTDRSGGNNSTDRTILAQSFLSLFDRSTNFSSDKSPPPSPSSSSFASPHFSKSYHKDEVLSKTFGVTSEEANRVHALKVLGVREEDVKMADNLFNPAPNTKGTKQEQLLGYSDSQITRSKALAILGETEESVELHRQKVLGNIGTSAPTPQSSESEEEEEVVGRGWRRGRRKNTLSRSMEGLMRGFPLSGGNQEGHEGQLDNLQYRDEHRSSHRFHN